jgi:hypothetical protein
VPRLGPKQHRNSVGCVTILVVLLWHVTADGGSKQGHYGGPWKGLSLLLLHSLPTPPPNLREGCLLVRILSHIPSLWLAPFPQPLLLRSCISPLLPCLVTSALEMETACFSKTLVLTCKTTWCQDPRQHIHHHNHCENLKSHFSNFILQKITFVVDIAYCITYRPRSKMVQDVCTVLYYLNRTISGQCCCLCSLFLTILHFLTHSDIIKNTQYQPYVVHMFCNAGNFLWTRV